MIAFTCASCGKSLTVKDEHAGKRAACPHCKQAVVVPARAADVTAAQAEDGPSLEGVKLDFLAPAQKPDELGRLGQYRVLKVLGAGGMGMVLQAEDPVLKRHIALKVMQAELAAKEVNRKRFLLEARATAAVEHPHIVPIHQVGQERGVPFIAMPFLKGESLDTRLKRETTLPVAEAVRIARQTAAGLAAAHAAGLVHRDIKPGNLWLEAKTYDVKILDFGLARVAGGDAHLTQSGTILGTPAYMAPEQASAGPVDHRCDLFSLGAVLYRMLTGELPFKGQDALSIIASLIRDTPRPVRELNAQVPPGLNDLVMQMLAKEPGERPADAKTVADVLAVWETPETPPLSVNGTVPVAVPVNAPRRRRSRMRVVLAAAGLLVLIVLGLLLGPRFPSGADSRSAAKPGPLEKQFRSALGIEFVLVPKGRFLMGGGSGKVGTKEVDIEHDFYLGKFELTQGEWEAVTGSNPSHFSRTGDGRNEVANIPAEELKRFPVEMVSWDDVQAFLVRLNAREQHPGWVYRLPTEAEWEYACRGGPLADRTAFALDFFFDRASDQLLPGQANFDHDKALKRTCKVGSYAPNRLGLYDMHGNVWEWCADTEKAEDGTVKAAFRGGSWVDEANICAAAVRNVFPTSDQYHNFGVRLARVPVGKSGK